MGSPLERNGIGDNYITGIWGNSWIISRRGPTWGFADALIACARAPSEQSFLNCCPRLIRNG